jgi:hypothetical protein
MEEACVKVHTSGGVESNAEVAAQQLCHLIWALNSRHAWTAWPSGDIKMLGRVCIYKGGFVNALVSESDNMHDTKTVNKQGQGEASSLSSGVSSSTRATSSPGRAARRVSMKIKKGLKEVKEMLSPHHHHQQSPDGHRRRRSGPNDSRRGPLAPVLDHLEKSNSVPIHLHISHDGSFSVARKGSSSSYSCSDIAHDESETLADIHQHIQQPQQQQQQHQQQLEPVQPSASLTVKSEDSEDLQPLPLLEMEVPEPYIDPPSPRHSDGDDDGDDGERTPNPFLVDDPEDPLSDPGSPAPASSPLEVPLSEPIVLSPGPASSGLPLPTEPEPAAPPAVDKPVPALPVSSDTESETTEAPAAHLPQLVMPTMFLPIPNVRISSPLTWWLTSRTPIYY